MIASALEMFSQPLVERLGRTLIHFVWQGTIVWACLAIMLRQMQGRSANARYLASCVALLLMMALPVLTLSVLRADADPSRALAEVEPGNVRTDLTATHGAAEANKVPEANLLGHGHVPASAEPDRDELVVEDVYGYAAEETESRENAGANPISTNLEGPDGQLTRAPSRSDSRYAVVLNGWLPWLVATWIAGVVVLSTWHLLGWRLSQRLCRRATEDVPVHVGQMLGRLCGRLGIRRVVSTRQSALATAPMLIGWLKPVLLAPACVLSGLSTSELEAILAHELAHIRRNDYVVNLCQTVVETLLFYHPAVWWVSRRIRIEREFCADDWATRLCTGPDAYAKALATLGQIARRPPRCAVASTGPTLVTRVRRVLGLPTETKPHGLQRLAHASGAAGLFVAAGLVAYLAASAESQPPRLMASETRREPPAAPATVDELQAMWEQLGCDDAARGRQIMRALKASKEKSVPLLADMLQAGTADETSLDSLIGELDSPRLEVRRRAFEQFARLDRVAEEHLRRALKKTESAEVKSTGGMLLEACEKPLYTTALTRRKVRAIWALEAIGDGRARRALRRLAAGDPRCRTAGLATAALARLDGQPQRAGDCVPRMRYEAKPKQARIPCNGRMIFQTRLSNEGKAPAVVYWGDYAYEDMYRFTVKRKDGLEIASPRRRLVPPNGTVREKYFREIPPGESVSYNVYLSASPAANAQRYYFRFPGVYTVQPSFSATITESLAAGAGQSGEIPGAWTGDLETEPVSITIEGDPNVQSDWFQLSGQVVDPDGKPVVGAHVVAQRRIWGTGSLDGYALRDVQQAYTDAEGRYSLPGLPLDCPLFFLEVTHAQWPRVKETVTMTPPKKRYETKIVMPQGVTLRGVAVDSSGEPIAGVRVDSRGKEVWTDADGRYVLEGVPKPENGDKFEMHFWKRGSISRTVDIPREQATSKSCRIKLLRMDELTASGIAVFADGSPVANLSLDFHIPGTRQWVRRAKTDQDGRFSVELPEPRAFKGHVEAIGPGESHLPRRRWCTTIDAVKPGQSDLRLVFDNRDRIRVAIQPANTLPTSLQFDVTCEMSKLSGGLTTIAIETLQSEGGEIDLENLAPGKYRLTARVKEAGHWNWRREVVVGERPEERSVGVEFKLPTMEFGSVKALILQPDGKTPVPRGRIWFGSSKSSGGIEFFNGKVELKEIPVGGISLETHIDGMAQQSVAGTVTANQTTDLGQIIVKRLEDAAGWVEGRVLYDDGTPALGAELGSDVPLGAPAVGADGDFRIQLMAGENAVDFDLSHAPGWPASAEFMAEFDRRGRFVVRPYDCIVVPLEVKPGKTVTRDVVLPRKPLRKLTLNWKGDPEEELFIGVIVDMKNYRLIRRYPFGRVKGKQIELPHLGSGATVVSVYAEGYFGYREVGAGVDDAVVTFGPDKAGWLEVQTVRADGTPVKGIRVTARPASLTPIDPIRGLKSRRWIFNMERALIQPKQETGVEPEAIARSACTPGRYVLTAQRNRANTKTVEVKLGQTAQATIVVDDH